MPRVIYVHGFLSSSQSKKAQQTARWLAKHRPNIEYLCPDLSSYPEQAKRTLIDVLSERKPEHNFLIGSSLGGFWASHCVEAAIAAKAVLINPAVSPQSRFAELVGQELSHYYTDERVCLSQEDLEVLDACEKTELQRPDCMWLLAQKGDEVLDYRLAEQRYLACKSTIEAGGDHGFVDYEKWLPEIIQFFGI